MTIARSLGVALCACALALAGCAQPPKRQDFDPEASARIRTVLVAQAPNQKSFIAAGGTGLGFSGIGVLDLFLLAAALALAVDQQIKTNQLTAAVDAVQTRLQDHFSEMLREGLNAQGYEASIVVLPSSGEPDQFLPFLRQQGAADAALVVLLDGRVRQAGPKFDYYPLISVKAKGFDLVSGAVLYEDTFNYGYPDPQVQSWQFSSDAKFRFASIEEMVADPAKVREAWLAGMRLIADKILVDVRRKQAP